MALTTLGIFHTLVGVSALIGASISLIKYGKIDLGHHSGKLYFYTTIITALTALGISKNGGFNAGHIFSLFILALVLICYFLHTRRKENKPARYIENFLFSFSFFLSWVPTINETFTRLPIGHPLAQGPKDPIIGKILLSFFILFIIGAAIQFTKQRKINKLL